MNDHAHAQAQEPVDGAHPARVAPGQVVVHRHHVDALALQRVQVDRQGGHQRFAFARLHFGDLALVQHHAADQLHVEVAHVEGAAPRLAAERKSFRQKVVERFTVCDPLLELLRADREVGVLQKLHLSFERVDFLYTLGKALQLALVLGADDLA